MSAMTPEPAWTPVRLEFGSDFHDGVETVVMVEVRPDGTLHVLDEWEVRGDD